MLEWRAQPSAAGTAPRLGVAERPLSHSDVQTSPSAAAVGPTSEERLILALARFSYTQPRTVQVPISPKGLASGPRSRDSVREAEEPPRCLPGT